MTDEPSLEVAGTYEPAGELLYEQRDSHRSKELTVSPLLETLHVSEIPGSRPGSGSNDTGNYLKRKASSQTPDGVHTHTARRLRSRGATPNASIVDPYNTDTATNQIHQKDIGEGEAFGETTDRETVAAETSQARTQYTRGRTLVGLSEDAHVLPARKVFPIQVGTELFRLSGASLVSDSPSYISYFFEEQIRQGTSIDEVRTLYIDRDPVIFRDISRHLQGYVIEPTDSTQFVRLFADAQWFRLPRLIKQLNEADIYIRIDSTEFRIPRSLFDSPGNSPNFFTLGFAMAFSTPSDVFPGLDSNVLLRPPPITPPSVNGRSARVFSDLLDMLKGYDIHIRNDTHRAELLRDAQYYHFRGLEQKLITHRICRNIQWLEEEITLRLEDIKPDCMGLGIDHRALHDHLYGKRRLNQGDPAPRRGCMVTYGRPFLDECKRGLIIETRGNISLKLGRDTAWTFPSFRYEYDARMLEIREKIETLLKKETELLNDWGVSVECNEFTDITIDDVQWTKPMEDYYALEDALLYVEQGLWVLQLRPEPEHSRAIRPVLRGVKLQLRTQNRHKPQIQFLG